VTVQVTFLSQDIVAAKIAQIKIPDVPDGGEFYPGVLLGDIVSEMLKQRTQFGQRQDLRPEHQKILEAQPWRGFFRLGK
jgi:hypothetical protein